MAFQIKFGFALKPHGGLARDRYEPKRAKEALPAMNNIIRDQWLWNPTPLRVLVSLFVLVPIIATTALYPSLGKHSLWMLLLSTAGLAFWAIYGKVGKRVTALSNSFSQEHGEIAECLIVNGVLQSPGVAVLRDDEIVLAPIIGAPTSVSLESISSVREVQWFNGSLLWWKKGFWLAVPGRKRLGFAVVDTIATRWGERLAHNK